jgi:hypothetical protein
MRRSVLVWSRGFRVEARSSPTGWRRPPPSGRDEEARRPEFRFPLQTAFEELVWGNVLLTREEQDRLLRKAGFVGDITRELIGEGFTVLTTQRG